MVKFSTPSKLITIFFASAFLFIIQQAFSSASGPVSGVTGAPGESDCTSCHSGTATANSSAISVYSNMTNGQYIPDSTYHITIRARTTGCVKFGFETTMLNNTGSPSKLGTLAVPTAATKIQLSTGARDYISHTSSGTAAGYTDSTDWVFDWQAPSTLQGDARLYVAMNATDNSGSNSGDEIHLNDFSFPQTTNVPVATITTNVNSTCQNDSILFSASGTNSTSSYQWTFQNGTPATSTLQNVWVKFTSGNKLCSLRVANNIIQSAYTTKSVTINAFPTATLSYNSTVVLCDGDSLPLSVPNVSGYSYQWQKDGSNINGANSFAYYAKQSGNFRVIISNNGCNTISATASLTFNIKPQAVLVAPNGNTTCQGDSIWLKANSGTNYSYYWYKDNVLLLQSLDSNYYVKQNGNYNVKIVTALGCNKLSNVITLSMNPKPAGTIVAPIDSVCQGDSILLIASSTDTITSYQWKRNGSNISGINGKSYYAKQSGLYTVELTTNRGCIGTTSSKPIVVNSLPANNFIDSVKNACTYSLRLRNTGTFKFEWQLNGITINTTDTIITATQSGLYSLVISNSSGCSIVTNSISLVIANAPNSNITPLTNAILCSDSSGVTYQVPFANGVTYKWFKNGSIINGANQNALNLVDSGNYYVLVDNGSCAVTSSTRNVRIIAAPAANFIDSIKSGCAYFLKVRNAGALNYEWQRNGVVFNSIDSVVNVTQSGNYTLRISNASGCSRATNSIVLSIPTNQPDVTMLPSVNAVICSDSNGVTYQVPAISGIQYKWYKNGNQIIGANLNSLLVVDSGNYFVTADNGSCMLTSAIRNVKINPTPTAFIASGNTAFCTGDSAALTTATVSGATYQWVRNNVIINNSNKATYYVTQQGVYEVRVTLGSCQKISNTITMSEKPIPALPVVTRNTDLLTSSLADGYQWFKNGVAVSGAKSQNFTVTGTGTYTVEIVGTNGCKNVSSGIFVIPTGIDEGPVSEVLNAFPNPVSNSLQLNFVSYGSREIIVFDASGRELSKGNETDSKAVIDFRTMEAGIYFVKVTSRQTSQIIRVTKK